MKKVILVIFVVLFSIVSFATPPNEINQKIEVEVTVSPDGFIVATVFIAKVGGAYIGWKVVDRIADRIGLTDGVNKVVDYTIDYIKIKFDEAYEATILSTLKYIMKDEISDFLKNHKGYADVHYDWEYNSSGGYTLTYTVNY